MSDSQDKWDRIYARGSHNAKVAAILNRHTDLVQTGGLALAIACGQGTNAVALAALGMEVDAWDISAVAIEQLKDAAHRQRRLSTPGSSTSRRICFNVITTWFSTATIWTGVSPPPSISP